MSSDQCINSVQKFTQWMRSLAMLSTMVSSGEHEAEAQLWQRGHPASAEQCTRKDMSSI